MFLPVRFSRMSPVPLCTCQGHADGWTHGPSAPPGAPPASAGYLWRWEPSGCRGALGQHPARPRPAALARGGRLSPRPVPTLQHFQHGRRGRGLPEAVRVGRWWARPRPAHRVPWGRGTPSGAWHKRGALRPSPRPSPVPHSRLRCLLHALGAEARLGQEGAQQLSRVGVPRGVIAARGRGVRWWLGGGGDGV